jgi:hypothetical protein
MANLDMYSLKGKERLIRGYYRLLCQMYGPPLFFKGIYPLSAIILALLVVEAEKLGGNE